MRKEKQIPFDCQKISFIKINHEFFSVAYLNIFSALCELHPIKSKLESWVSKGEKRKYLTGEFLDMIRDGSAIAYSIDWERMV